eukprot:TRINITY_DN20192_c0_g1_i2.p1 TRINITY_DN20192_c0_g1~~TRINITY_DN20192_c0_g1_i2.p1  ORF type:complete len:583 (+),score=164.38 TRINITY_DN20192_c0_g1_i2:104-1852(+)
MAERRRSSGSRALDRRNRERAGVLSRRSDAPGGFETDYSAGASLLPEDSASQAPPDRVWKPFEETPAKSDTRRGSRGVHFQEDDVAASQSQADSMTLISSMRQEDIVEGRLKRELIRDLRALPGGCDAAMNANCCTVDVKVAVTRFSQVTAERSLPAGEFRIEYAVIPTSKLIKLRSLCDERLASNVLAKGSTGWRQMDSQTMACSFGTGEWVEPAAGTWQRLRVPDGQCLPNHLNRRYLEFRVFRRRAEGEGGLAEEEEWRHHGGSMRAEMVFRAKVAEAKRSRRSAKIKLKSPDGLSEYELVAAVSMAKISDAQKQPPPPLPPPPKPEVAIAAVRKSRAADIELPPPEAEEAPLVTKGAAEVAANEDADADGGGIDVVKVVRNLGIGLVAGAVMGMGVGALLGWMLGGTTTAAATAAGASKGAAAGTKAGAAAGATTAGSSTASAASTAAHAAAPASHAAAAAAPAASHAATGGASSASASAGGSAHAAGSSTAAAGSGSGASSGTTGASSGAVSFRAPASGHIGAAEASTSAADGMQSGALIGGGLGVVGAAIAMLVPVGGEGGFCDPNRAELLSDDDE